MMNTATNTTTAEIIKDRDKETIPPATFQIPDEINWKPKSKVWPLLAPLSYVLALVSSSLFKDVLPAKPFAYRVILGFFILFLSVTYILTYFNKKIKAKFNHKSQFYFAGGLSLLIWDFLSAKTGVLPLPFFPGPAKIAQVALEDSSLILISTGYSLRLFFVSFLIGTFLGIVTGVLIGWYRQWYYWVFPVLKVTGVIPAVAWIPIAMMIFPTSFAVGIFLIVMCVWFPVAYMTCSGIVNIQKSYFEAARTLGASEWFLVFKIALPGSVPSIFTGISTATGLSFTTLVVSEMIGAKAGLGWYINWAKGWSIYSKVYAAIIIMAVAFGIILAVIGKIRARLLIWQKGLVK